MSFSFSDDVKIMPAASYAAGTADITDNQIIDTAGYDSVCFVVHNATIAAGAVTSIKISSGAASDLSDGADLLGTSVSIAADDDDELKYIDLHQNHERYVRLIMDKDAANSYAGSAVAYLYNGRAKRPITQLAGTTEGERHVAPGEGTA